MRNIGDLSRSVIMVEISKGCMLQWPSHAAYITKRFNGLLARQALVDVTLVCNEQKLRVHKLVLASNSAYFEEILQQDLGQESIIFLKDLEFGILKAMVEFMYCGKTTISYQHLSSLLTAAKTFKIKELVLVIDKIIDSKKLLKDCEDNLKQEKNNYNLNTLNNFLTEDDYAHVKCDQLSMDDKELVCENNSNNDQSSSKNQSLENDMIEGTEHELEHTLYEDSDETDASKKDVSTSFSASDINMQGDTTYTVSTCNVNKVQTICTSDYNEKYCNNYDLKPILYEQCCDLPDINERDQISTVLSQSCLPPFEKNLEHCSGNNTDVPSKIKKYVKVYTHKKRKSTNNVRNEFVHMHNSVPTPHISTDRIDLLDEPSANDVPVSLLTSLDIESTEYILSLSKESIQSIVGGNINDKHAVIGYKEINAGQDANIKEQLNSTDDTNFAKPMLRRSIRLSQQDGDEGMNTSYFSRGSTGGERLFKKSNSPSGRDSCVKSRRKGKEDRKVLDQTSGGTVQSNKKNLNKKNNRRLIVKKTIKSVCTAVGSKEKEEQKSKVANKFKTLNTGGPGKTSVKHNTTECINRALWGDMSDTLDDRENEINLLTSNTQIPFAVGLLPLRTALEKMQATPDYQPRKTRSSVAPTKQDMNNLKRRSYISFEADVSSKKQNYNNNESPNTVCHIQIRTAPSQYVKSRKRFLSESIANLGTTDVANTQ